LTGVVMVLGVLLGIPLAVMRLSANRCGPALTAVIGLTLHEADYAAEVVRGDAGQTEAAQALGIGKVRALRRIVVPQTMRSIVPTADNMLIGTLKGTSIVSVLAGRDGPHIAAPCTPRFPTFPIELLGKY
jgi:polar amino acid transport system permease protein